MKSFSANEAFPLNDVYKMKGLQINSSIEASKIHINNNLLNAMYLYICIGMLNKLCCSMT